jgi:hemerythrin-like domain-containing protein
MGHDDGRQGGSRAPQVEATLSGPQALGPQAPEPRAFAQLKRCHRRLEEAVEALRTAAREHDMETASDVSAFFGRQIRRHEEDEERSLFPRLLDPSSFSTPPQALSTPPQALASVHRNAELRASIERLSAEHRTHEALHQRLERAVSGRDEDVSGASRDPWSELEALADDLAVAYSSHIEEEEKRLFPAALDVLTPRALDEILSEMDSRRGR